MMTCVTSGFIAGCYNMKMYLNAYFDKRALRAPAAWWKAGIFVGGLLCCLMAAGCSRSEAHLFGKAEGAQRVGSYDQAVEFYQAYLKKYPYGEFAEKSLYNLGNIDYLNLRDPSKARVAYEKFLEKYPMSQYAFTVGERLAELYSRDLQDHHKAIDVLEQISLHTPSRDDWRRVRYEIADNYFLLDEFDQAILEFKKVIDDRPMEHRSDESRIKLAAIYEIRKQWHDAIDQLQQVIANSKCDECRRHAQFEIVDCYASLEQYSQAINAVKQISARPEDENFLKQRLADLERQKSDRHPPREVNWKRVTPRRGSSAARQAGKAKPKAQ